MRGLMLLGAVLAAAGCAGMEAAGSERAGLEWAGLTGQPPPAAEGRASMPAAAQAEPSLDARAILERAHAAAGGETWLRPGSLKLTGYNIVRAPDGGEKVWDRYAMWRVFADEKGEAHAASGKVRIEAWSEGELAMLIAFDGEVTSN